MLPCSLVGNFGRDVPTLTKNAATLRNPAVSDPPPPDAKTISTLAAKFAIAGGELHVIHEGDRTYFEVRRWGQCRTCSTLHDLGGFLAQIEATA